MGALADCELVSHSFFGQPVNSITTAAFIVAGLVVARRGRLRWVGAGLVATGVGSFLFHGPMTGGSEWAHDVSLAWLVLLIAGLGSRWETWSRLPGLLVLGVVFALSPQSADPIAVGLTLVALAAIVRAEPSAATLALLGGLGLVAALGRLGSTGGPMCDPASPWQWHGFWHVGAALVVAWWSLRWLDRHADLYPA